MNFVKRIFGTVHTRYLIRAYAISVALLAYMVWFFASQEGLLGYQKAILYGYAIISAILFPFSKLVWDELKGLMSNGSTVTITPLNEVGLMISLMRFVGKVMVNVLLWFFGIGIAPLGILYLWLRNRAPEEG